MRWEADLLYVLKVAALEAVDAFLTCERCRIQLRETAAYVADESGYDTPRMIIP
jgi:hypothetical protein